jgi:hypothetical protein
VTLQRVECLHTIGCRGELVAILVECPHHQFTHPLVVFRDQDAGHGLLGSGGGGVLGGEEAHQHVGGVRRR